jgi:hypothetical protein
MKSLTRFNFQIGIFLIITSVVLFLFKLKIPLNNFLLNEYHYKAVTGLLLVIYILAQWRVSKSRFTKQSATQVRTAVTTHKSLGLIGPIVLLIHSQKVGFGYLKILSLSFYISFTIGIFHERIIKLKNPSLTKLALITHIGSSTLMLGIIIYHIFIVLYY